MIELRAYKKAKRVFVNEKKINWIADCRDSMSDKYFTRLYMDNGEFLDVQELYEEVQNVLMEKEMEGCI